MESMLHEIAHDLPGFFGTSGAPVVMRAKEPEPMHSDLPWILLGVHSAVIDVGTRDLNIDEALGRTVPGTPISC